MEYQFKDFSLDITNRQLMIAEKDVTIDERAYALFNALIAAYPAECTKQELMTTIWQDIVVSDWSLSKLVSDTRKAFKKAGYTGPLIYTVHGKGYRLEKELAQQLQNNPPAPEHNQPAVDNSTELTQSIYNPLLKIGNMARSTLFAIAMLVILVGWGAYTAFSTSYLIVNEPENTIARVLWVDDNPSNNGQEHKHLEKNKIGVYPVTTTREALRLLSLYDYEVVISDMGRHNDGLAGIKLLEQMRTLKIETPFLLYTWHTTDALQREIEAHGGQGVLVDSQSLYARLQEIIPASKNTD